MGSIFIYASDLSRKRCAAGGCSRNVGKIRRGGGAAGLVQMATIRNEKGQTHEERSRYRWSLGPWSCRLRGAAAAHLAACAASALRAARGGTAPGRDGARSRAPEAAGAHGRTKAAALSRLLGRVQREGHDPARCVLRRRRGRRNRG